LTTGGHEYRRGSLACRRLAACFGIPRHRQTDLGSEVTDFFALVALYARSYGPYFWKIQAFDHDMLQIQPWLARVNAAQTDLEFYDVCERYVTALHDYHSDFYLPADHEALLPFTVDFMMARFWLIPSTARHLTRRRIHSRLAMSWSPSMV
jgi:hypothetical protein